MTTCKVCSEELPKYLLDRYAESLCGYGCDRFLEGAAVAFGLMGMAIEIGRKRCHECTGLGGGCVPPEDTICTVKMSRHGRLRCSTNAVFWEDT